MRKLATALVLSTLLAALAPGGPARAEGSPARLPIERLHVGLEQAMKDAAELGFSGRYERLEPLLDDAYDFPFMAARTIGRQWKTLPPEQQQRWLELFRELTIATYADRFDAYGGERFELLGDEPAPKQTVLVKTRIVPQDAEIVELDYRMREKDGRWRIIDVYLQGTVSELALRRSDYSTLLKRDGFAALEKAVTEKIEAARRGEGDA